MAKIIKNVDKIETTSGTVVDLDNISAGGGLDGIDTTNAAYGEPLVWDSQVNQWVAEADLSPPPIPPGEAAYTSPGNYTWTAPTNVTSVCVVCVGGGGAGGYQWPSGGGAGGGLGWKNDIPVTPGQTYTVVVGDRSSTASRSYNTDAMGNTSYFIDTNTVAGFGAGRGGTDSLGSNTDFGGGWQGDGGGRGGTGSQGSYTMGGGGAGGYTGHGGNAAQYGNPGGGGGGASGKYYSTTYGTPAGGGVGIYGQGADGVVSTTPGEGGGGGSGGSDGRNGEMVTGYEWGNNQIMGGNYGGGGGGSGTSSGGGRGAQGAVRIIWGNGRSFPTNAA